MQRVSIGSFLVLGLISSVASAQTLSLDAQERSTAISIPSFAVGDSGVNQSEVAIGFDPFVSDLQGSVPSAGATAGATADSFFSAFGNDFVLSGLGGASYDVQSDSVTAVTSADSVFSVTFALEQETEYLLDGFGTFLPATGNASSFLVRLVEGTDALTTDPGAVIAEAFGDENEPVEFPGARLSRSFQQSSSLLAGTYTLYGQAGVSGLETNGEISASYDVALELINVIPEPSTAGAVLAGLGLLAARRRR